MSLGHKCVFRYGSGYADGLLCDVQTVTLCSGDVVLFNGQKLPHCVDHLTEVHTTSLSCPGSLVPTDVHWCLRDHDRPLDVLVHWQLETTPPLFQALMDSDAAAWTPVCAKLKRLNVQIRDAGALSMYGGTSSG